MAETAPHHRFAVMTASLVAANVLLFLLTLFLSHALRPDNEVLALGWKNNASVVAGQIWRLVTCCLLHAGWTHLILNMALLWYVGSVLEDTLGPWPPLVIYWVSGVAGAALSCTPASRRTWDRESFQRGSTGSRSAGPPSARDSTRRPAGHRRVRRARCR